MIGESVRFNLEADSLNYCILGPDAAPGSEEFYLFVKEVVKEMTSKAGQKCTAIRRVFVHRDRLDEAREEEPNDPPVPDPAERPDPDPPEPRPRRRLLRVDLLIALAAVVLLLVGFLIGMAVTRAASDEPPPVADTASPAAPSTSIVVRQAPPPRECLIAMERADAAIAYLVGNIRDQRLSDTIQEFVESRRACQAAVR